MYSRPTNTLVDLTEEACLILEATKVNGSTPQFAGVYGTDFRVSTLSDMIAICSQPVLKK
jgi:hypothetical protein